MKSDRFDDFDADETSGDLPWVEDFRDELAPGETLVWTGRPRQRWFSFSMLPVAVFGCFFGGFAAFWIGGALSATGMIPGWPAAPGPGPGPGPIGWLFPLFGLPFLLIGLAMASSPIWAARKQSRSRYALTDRRVITRIPGWGAVEVRSYHPDDLGSVSRVQRRDGSGDLIFERRVRVDGEGQQSVTRLGLFGVDRVKEVEDLIRSTLLRDRGA